MTPTATVLVGAGAICVGLILSGLHLMNVDRPTPVRARSALWLPAPLRRAVTALGLAPQPRPRTLPSPRIDMPEDVARRLIERLTRDDVADLVEPGVAINARWTQIGWTMVVDGGFVHAYGDGEKSLEQLERDVVNAIRDGRRREQRRSHREQAERDWRGGR